MDGSVVEQHSAVRSTARTAAVTLALITLLHGFTHAFSTLLKPLYLQIQADLGLSHAWQVTLIVSVYMVVYAAFSFAAGVLGDRFNRRNLLAIGLAGNAVAIAAMGLTRSYEILLLLAVVAGLFGTLFHPTANALAPAHYPRSPGLAIGLLGIGSGLGFFFGPMVAGLRADHGDWAYPGMADWQRPCIEMGVVGLLVAGVFMLLAREAPRRASGAARSARLSPALRRRTAMIAIVLGNRDFAGVASMSLVSLFLQKAHGYGVKQAGFAIGAMMAISIVANPLSVYVSPGRRRLPMLAGMLVLGGVCVAAVPWLPLAAVLPVLCVFQLFQLGSYSVSDAAMLERVDDAVRGRVVGLFLTVAATYAATSPWVIGFWVDMLGASASDPRAYAPIFATLGAMMLVATLGVRLIAKLGPAHIAAHG